MRKLVCIALLAAMAATAYAELQNVEVGGEIRIRGRWWHNGWKGERETRIPDFFVPRRPIGPFGVSSLYGWNSNDMNDRRIVEQKTLISVKADFTDDVCALIALDSFDIWGEDFRSNYITGADARANTADDIEVYQAYIQMDNMFDMPIRARIGRQELVMGKGWLVGNQISATLGLSFDAIRLTYNTEMFEADAFWAKLAERSPIEEDGDVDLYGVYATYKQYEALKASAYWFYVRDARSINDTNFIAPLEWFEDFLRLDDYDTTNLHTVGIRLFGAAAGFDYDLEAAYQFGEADSVGQGFRPANQLYGDDGARFSAWAADLEVGYTIDMAWQPRVYVGGAYYGGEDNRDLTLIEWLNPFYRPEASVSFNRLFSKIWYTNGYDILGGAAALSNFTQARAGVTVNPTESLTAGLALAYFWTNEPFDAPVSVTAAGWRIPVAPALSFWTSENSKDMGPVAHLWLKYDYSEDLFFRVGWERVFTGAALEQGSFILANGLDFSGGTDDKAADYFYFDTGLTF